MHLIIDMSDVMDQIMKTEDNPDVYDYGNDIELTGLFNKSYQPRFALYF